MRLKAYRTPALVPVGSLLQSELINSLLLKAPLAPFLYAFLSHSLSLSLSLFFRAAPASPDAPADFETAIAATGYGRFNYLLLLVAMPCCMTTVFETTTMSYVLPSAECDLNLTLADKGMLNAITYTGR